MTEVTKIRKARPSIYERAQAKVCPECGGAVVRRSARGPFPTFCCEAHKKAYRNRLMVEGLAMAAFIKAWRIDRAQGEIAQASFAQLCQIADQFNAQDNEEGRERADLYAAKMLADGTKFMDRQHAKNLRESLAKAAA